MTSIHRPEVDGQHIDLGGRRLYVEESGHGEGHVVFEAGLGFGRTSWDPVIPLLRDAARLTTYDRLGHGLSEPGNGPTSIPEMATTLCELIDARVPGNLVLVAHSMGGLIARWAAVALGSRLDGLVLIDPTPETAAMYDDVTRLTRQQDRLYGLFEGLSKVRQLRPVVASVSGRPFRRVFPPATYKAIAAEDFRPSSFAQMRREAAARADAVVAFRRQPPAPPKCPVVLLSAGRVPRGAGKYLTDIQEHQRQYVDALQNARFETADSMHIIQAEQPELVSSRIREFLAAS
ncbi:alpha/beta fold hydrolase [Nocardia sp. NPDC101769]|uniref:alpha/beta fold hydrolase n=1 Tax=Nocardia sp. NPDC101769 TaxID=3364333 RepID=UPI00380FE689